MANTKKTSVSRKIPVSSHFYILFILSLFLGLGASVGVFFWRWGIEESRLLTHYTFEAGTRMTNLERTLKHSLFSVQYIKLLYEASEKVESDEFQRFVRPLLTNTTGLESVLWLSQESGQDRSMGGNFVIQYAAAGRNMSIHESGNLKGHPRLLKIIQEHKAPAEIIYLEKAGGQMTFHRLWILLPIFGTSKDSQERVPTPDGYIAGIFRLDKIFRKALERTSPNEMMIFLFDEAPETSNAGMLYAHLEKMTPQKSREEIFDKLLKTTPESFIHTKQFKIGDENWKLYVFPMKEYFASATSELPFLVFLCTLLISGFISAYVWFNLRKAVHIEKAVQERTSQLKKLNLQLEDEVKGHEKTAEKLLESNEKWKSLVENAPNIIVITSPEGEILFINRTEIGKSPKEVLGTNVLTYVIEEHQPIIREVFARALKTGKKQNYEVAIRNDMKELIWYSGQVGPVTLERGIRALMIITSNIMEYKEFEKKLKEAKDFLDKIIGSVADPIFVKDRQHRWVLLNDAYCEFMGYERADLLGKSDYDFSPKTEADVFWEKDELVFNTGQSNENEERFTDKHGVTHIVSTKKTLYLDKDNNKFIVGIIRDISSIKKIQQILEENKKVYAELFEGAPDPIIRFNAHGEFEALNTAAEQAIGYQKDQVAGKHFAQIGFLAENSKGKMIDEFQKIAAGESRPPFEVEVVLPDSTAIIYEAKPKSIESNGQVLAVQFILRDITERKMRKELEIKSQFISMVSHELRTPLHTIKEAVDVVLDEAAGAINPEQREFLEIATRNTNRLARFINDVLDFQKADRNDISYAMYENSINQLIKDVQKNMQLRADEKKIELKVDLDETIPFSVFDWDKMTQVLTNLVDNAVKFTQKGSVEIKTKLEGSQIKVSVTDTGRGIAEEDMGKLFSPFEQIRGVTTKKQEGTGLGLAISKKIIERHQGKIWAESVKGKGSSFIFLLPLKLS